MNFFFWATAAVAVFTFCSCSSVSKKQTLEPLTWPPLKANQLPPLKQNPNGSLKFSGDPQSEVERLEALLKKHPSESMRDQVRFLTARVLAAHGQSGELARACLIWNELAGDLRFPLHQVARLDAQELCPEAAAGRGLDEAASSEAMPGWLREKAVRAGLAQAARERELHPQNADASRREVQLSIELAPYLHVQAEQITLLQRAQLLAHGLGNSQAEDLAQQTLWKIAPRLIPAPTPEQYSSVAADFKRARDFEKAREYYQREFSRADIGAFEKLRALDGLRMTYKVEGNHEKFIATTREYSDFARQHFYLDDSGQPRKARNDSERYVEKYVDTRMTLARAIWNENSPREAQKVLDQLEGELKGRPKSEKILFLRARIEEEAGHLEKVARLLGEVDESTVPDKSERLKFLWYRAWSLRKLRRYEAAIQALRRSIELETSVPLLARDHFWLGRTLKENGDVQAAVVEFNWLTANDPMGYYGLLSYRELKQSMPPLEPTRADATPASKVTEIAAKENQSLSSDERMIFEWLIGTGELELARNYLDQFNSARRATLNEEQALDFLHLYARTGSYQALFARTAELTPERRMQILLKQPELIFPRPWADLIAPNSEKFHVPSELVNSIIRQESSFNPRARSIADAFGLMQLIPASATRAERLTGITIATPEELYLPEINIPLGIAFFHDLLEKWGGHFIPAVASYNANEITVARWLKTRDVSDPLQFIEDIPYEETRIYVKLVLRNFIFYSRLNSVTESVPFPEWCLNGLQDNRP